MRKIQLVVGLILLSLLCACADKDKQAAITYVKGCQNMSVVQGQFVGAMQQFKTAKNKDELTKIIDEVIIPAHQALCAEAAKVPTESEEVKTVHAKLSDFLAGSGECLNELSDAVKNQDAKRMQESVSKFVAAQKHLDDYLNAVTELCQKHNITSTGEAA